MAAAPREAATEYSKRRVARGGLSGLWAGVLVAGLVGGLLLIAADLSTLLEVRIGSRVIDRPAGADQHTYALLVLGLAALPIAAGAALARSRPAAGALALIGLIALLIALVGDAPDVNRSGLTAGFRRAHATPGLGFWLELAGGAAVLLAGAAGGLVAPRGDSRRR